MIPKIIHYCWFGENELSPLAKKCIDSWKKHCPNYQIIEWNEKNFDISCNDYVREAYEFKKYAFVTDYVRLYVMYTYGGIYMDTDVEVVNNLDQFLIHEAFSGFEDDAHIPTGIMACEKNFTLFGELLDYYKGKHFIKENGEFDLKTNVETITNLLSQKGFVPNGKLQSVENFTLYPKEYFCPLDYHTRILNKTKNTCTIHWFNASWHTEEENILHEYNVLKKKFVKLFGNKLGIYLFRMFYFIFYQKKRSIIKKL